VFAEKPQIILRTIHIKNLFFLTSQLPEIRIVYGKGLLHFFPYNLLLTLDHEMCFFLITTNTFI